MKRIVLAIVLAASIAGCSKHSKEPQLQENTEAYFAAHGIVPGQVNELRIGGALFRFPAGVGLNPSTPQETYRSKDGSPMTLSTKEGIEQGKYEKVATPIVKGRTDKVTFFLDSKRNHAPGSDPFQSGDVRVEISKSRPAKWDAVNINLHRILEEIKGRKYIDHLDLGLREFVAPTQAHSEYFEDIRPDRKSSSGYGKFIRCHPTPHGFSHPSGLCFRSYWEEAGLYQVRIIMDKSLFFENWQGTYPAASNFVNSIKGTEPATKKRLISSPSS